MTDVLVVGESLVDIVQRADGTSLEYAGGSAANVAVSLARLGRPVAFVTAYADDERGGVLARHLNQSAVGIAGDPHALERTATAVATLAEDGSASYTFDIDWRLNPVPDLSPVVVHTCSLGAVLAPGAADVQRLLERLRPTATVSYDVNARPAVTGTGAEVVRAVEEVVALADLLKASDEDLEALYPGDSIEQAVRVCSRWARPPWSSPGAATVPPGSGVTPASTSRRATSRSPTPSAPATPSAPPSSTPCGS